MMAAHLLTFGAFEGWVGALGLLWLGIGRGLFWGWIPLCAGTAAHRVQRVRHKSLLQQLLMPYH